MLFSVYMTCRLLLLCSFRFGRLYKPTGRNCFLAVNARAMSLLSDYWSEICFIGTNKAVLVCHSRSVNWISNSVLKIMLA